MGKTTTSVALAGLLADSGKRVVVLDLDPHGSMTSYFGHDPDNLEHSVFDLFQHQGTVPEGLPWQLLLATSHERISLMPSSTVLATLERQSPGQNGVWLVIAKSLSQLWQDFDYAIIDSPPLLGVLMVNAPGGEPAAGDSGTDRVPGDEGAGADGQRTLAMINRSRKQALPYTIVPTLFDRRTQASMNTPAACRLCRSPVAGLHPGRYSPARCQPRRPDAVAVRPGQPGGDCLSCPAQASAGVASLTAGGMNGMPLGG